MGSGEKDFMRRHSLFAGLSDEDLDQLYEMAERIFVPAGTCFIEEGGHGDTMYVVVDGEIEVSKREGSSDVVLAIRGPGEVIGEMALLEHTPRFASVKTLRDSNMLVISQTAFQTLLDCSPTALLAMLRTVAGRLRSTQAMLTQHEKLAGLGTLAAGLAHELNNPAAAIRRSSEHLREALDGWERAASQLGSLGLDAEQTARLDAWRDDIVRRAGKPPLLDPLTLSEREDDLQAWLEDHGVEKSWEVAPSLVASGWDNQELEEMTGWFSDVQIPVIVRWLASATSVYGLLGEIGQSAEGISEIVKSVKTYSFLDQAPIQTIDVHESLESTLVMLRHKLKGGVEVVRDYASDLPRIEAYGSELNQVWTNIIDNAIDAMHGEGRITIRTRRRDGNVVVEIEDNGPGIPPDVQTHIFEPFYTTKAPGVGTGLGLHIAYNIVTEKHRGRIEVTSAPGSTRFQVTLPLELRQA